MSATNNTIKGLVEDQSRLFVELVLRYYGFPDLNTAVRMGTDARALSPIIIEDYRNLSELNKADITKAYLSSNGVAYFIVQNPDISSAYSHPLFAIVSQLEKTVPVAFPLPHPLEGHPDSVARFGPSDGTVKIYDLPGKGGPAGYREQAETNEVFDMHHDGLGSGGTVQTVVLYMDSPPLFGGFTYFQNIPLLALRLAATDIEAFRSLFLPDAIVIIRPRGKGAIKVTTPVLFINDANRPQSFFRVASGEYVVQWRDHAPLKRARDFFKSYVPPFSPGSSFVHFTARGHGCIIDNQLIVHARTSFLDDEVHGISRLLSRKWYMRDARDSVYKHVPGMFINQQFAAEYASICDPKILEGEWRYDQDSDRNVRVL